MRKESGAEQPSVLLDAAMTKRLKMLTKCASNDLARPMLCCIGFDGTSAWATDSYVLARVPVQWAEKKGPLRFVEAKHLLAVLKAGPRDTVKLEPTVEVLNVFDGRGAGGTGGQFQASAHFVVPWVRGEYPRIDQVIPARPVRDEDRGLPPGTCFDPEKLARVAACATDLGRSSKLPPVTVWQTSPLKPIVVEQRGEFVGLVMPIKDHR